ncbi:hypothetical protein SNE40_020143 [Patella caerulea]|uniref:Protein kinase domain-containing protein n=1 Tax=Patella caerulea TaxID=87958 RepID=A0AAN8G3E8_PATCE
MDKDYIVLDSIDSGSFGEIHTLRKRNDDTIYAVKAIKACGHMTEDEYILAEIRSLIQLKHPHIITMYDVVLSHNFACIVMEYASCGNLERFTLKHQPLPQRFMMTSFQQILSAVEYCHSNDIAHKDINPSNILIFDDQCVKLADFGLAIKCHDACGNLVLCEDYLGQNSYLAPEILLNKPHCGMRADMWSLGCLLYFVICGKPPFEGEVNSIVKQQISNGIHPHLHVPDEQTRDSGIIFKIMTSLCKIVPEERLTSLSALELWGDLVNRTFTPR